MGYLVQPQKIFLRVSDELGLCKNCIVGLIN
jgi:hypothetical protein